MFTTEVATLIKLCTKCIVITTLAKVCRNNKRCKNTDTTVFNRYNKTIKKGCKNTDKNDT